MWSLMAFCLACTMVATQAREQQKGVTWWWPAEWQKRNGGGGPSLSIVNPLDVLRQRLQLETARRRQQENEQRIRDNEMLLRNLGKRTT